MRAIIDVPSPLMDWQSLSLNAAITIVGSGLGTTFVGILFKRKFDRELEVQKAFLYRSSRIHDRQVEALTRLYRYLTEAQAFLQLMAASAHFEGEKLEEYPGRFGAAITSARDELFSAKLLLPSELAKQCDDFFDALFRGQMHLGLAQHPMVTDGLQRAEFWSNTKRIAYEQLPQLLNAIELAARTVIHGEPSAKLLERAD